MRLVLDALPLLGPQTGVANYTRAVAQGLMDLGVQPIFYTGRFSRTLPKPATPSSLREHLRRIRPLARVYRAARRLLAAPSLRAFDVAWAPNFIPPAFRARHLVTTIHDFSFHTAPHWHPAERVAYFAAHFWPNLPRATAIITVSQAIARQAIQEFGIPAEKITVIPNGYDHSIFFPMSIQEKDAARQRLGVPPRFVLCVGSLEPRKNLTTLLDAYAMLPPAIQREHPLLVVGFSGWRNEAIMARLKRLQPAVRYLGFVETADLAALYNLAAIFVYPSLYEGFGLPPLEAMACGTPVVISHDPALMEVCGSAALAVPALDAEALADAIIRILQDTSLAQRLSLLGHERATHFSWQASVAAHRDLFFKLAS